MSSLNGEEMHILCTLFFSSYDQVYEEKRRRYLAARGHPRTSKPGHPATVQFQEHKGSAESLSLQLKPSSNTTTTATKGEEAASRLALKRAEHLVMTNHNADARRSESIGGLGNVSRDSPVDRLGSGIIDTSGPYSLDDNSNGANRDIGVAEAPEVKFMLATTVSVEDPKAEYARQLREQSATNAAAVQKKTSSTVGLRTEQPVVASPGAFSSSAVVANEAVAGNTHLSAKHALPRTTAGEGDARGGSDSRETAAAIGRKIEYGRQLREQMAVDTASRVAAAERDRRPPPGVATAAYSVKKDNCQAAAMNNHDPKAEYARQLREQMEETRKARGAEEQRERGQQPRTVDSFGLKWLAEASGRERQRRDSKAEYADQLRAQMEAQSTREY